jgi:hypothetical protein
MCGTLLPLLKHAIAYLPEFRVRFNVGLQIFFDVLFLRHRSIGRQWSSAKIDAEAFAPH